jgi:hypothetical protein
MKIHIQRMSSKFHASLKGCLLENYYNYTNKLISNYVNK